MICACRQKGDCNMDSKDVKQLTDEELEQVAGGSLVITSSLADIESQPKLAQALRNGLEANQSASVDAQIADLKQVAKAQGFDCSEQALASFIHKPI